MVVKRCCSKQRHDSSRQQPIVVRIYLQMLQWMDHDRIIVSGVAALTRRMIARTGVGAQSTRDEVSDEG